MSAARFEICRTEGGYFARFVAANNRIVWVTPGLLSRRRTVVAAIKSVAIEFDYAAAPYIRKDGRLYTSHGGHGQTIEVRDVDLRHEEDR